MKKRVFLIQSPDGCFRFVGIGVPLILEYSLKNPDSEMSIREAYEYGNSVRPRAFFTAIEAEMAADEIGFNDYVSMGKGPLPVTLYYSGDFMGGTHKMEGKLIRVGLRKYAQYDGAPFVQMIPKNKRNGIEIQKCSYSYLLVLHGHGHPAPQDAFVTVSSTSEITVRESRYLSHDSRYQTDFDAVIDQYIADKKPVVLFDARHTKGFNSYEKAFGYEVPVN